MKNITLTLFLICFCMVLKTANAQKVRVIDNKGTINELFIPSSVERFPNADQTIGRNTFTTLDFQSQSFTPKVEDYSVANDGITVLNDGKYKVICRISTRNGQNARMGGEFHLTLTSNGTITVVNNSKGFTYSRLHNVGRDTVSISKILELSANDKIGAQGRIYASPSTANTMWVLQEGTTLTVEKVD